jgi:hypothetical protein
MAHSSQENGQTERANREVYRHLRAILYDRKVVNTWHSVELVYGTDLLVEQRESEVDGLDEQLLQGGWAVESRRTGLRDKVAPLSKVEYTEWLKEKVLAKARVVSVASSLQKGHEDDHLKSVKVDKITKFPVGSYVLTRPYDNPLTGCRRPKTKLDLKWSGPFEVVSVEENAYTTLRDLTMTETFVKRHVVDLKEFKFDPRRTDPVDVALRGSEIHT